MPNSMTLQVWFMATGPFDVDGESLLGRPAFRFKKIKLSFIVVMQMEITLPKSVARTPRPSSHGL